MVLRQIRTLFDLGIIGELTDGHLLERFATSGGEAAELAFAALVERHGPMVLRICRNALRDPNDVEDAFQATFLVLVQRARSLWVEDSLAPWIHRVARRIAVRARAAVARRRDRERRAAEGRSARISDPGGDDGLMALLHEEIDRLPERCRVPIVLCDLEGLTHEQAARHLSWPIGTVKSRLTAGRERLRTRLVRRGIAPAVALLKVTMATPARSASAAVPAGLVETTVRSARLIAAGAGTTTAGAVPASIALLMEGALNTMFVTRIKFAFLACGLIAGGAVVAAQQAGRTGEGVKPRPAPTRVAGPYEARSDGPEADEAAVAREMAEAELDLLDDEVRQHRVRVSNALQNMFQLAQQNSQGDPSVKKGDIAAAEDEYQQARKNYLEKARELATRRQRKGPRTVLQLLPQVDVLAIEDREKDRPAAPSGSHGTAAAIGSIDMDAVLKRYAKVQRSQEKVSAAREDARERLAKLEAEIWRDAGLSERRVPNRTDYRAAEDLNGRIQKEREAAEREISQLHARESAGLLEDIQEVVADVAKARGLDYVIKVEARPRPDASDFEVITAFKRSVLYANRGNDVTEEVIRELNRRFAAAGEKSPR
jgi:RNA polymerase sigma factor (sigma-70 family)